MLSTKQYNDSFIYTSTTLPYAIESEEQIYLIAIHISLQTIIIRSTKYRSTQYLVKQIDTGDTTNTGRIRHINDFIFSLKDSRPFISISFDKNIGITKKEILSNCTSIHYITSSECNIAYKFKHSENIPLSSALVINLYNKTIEISMIRDGCIAYELTHKEERPLDLNAILNSTSLRKNHYNYVMVCGVGVNVDILRKIKNVFSNAIILRDYNPKQTISLGLLYRMQDNYEYFKSFKDKRDTVLDKINSALLSKSINELFCVEVRKIFNPKIENLCWDFKNGIELENGEIINTMSSLSYYFGKKFRSWCKDIANTKNELYKNILNAIKEEFVNVMKVTFKDFPVDEYLRLASKEIMVDLSLIDDNFYIENPWNQKVFSNITELAYGMLGRLEKPRNLASEREKVFSPFTNKAETIKYCLPNNVLNEIVQGIQMSIKLALDVYTSGLAAQNFRNQVSINLTSI